MKWDLSILYGGFQDQKIDKDFKSLEDTLNDMEELFKSPGDFLPALERFCSLAEKSYLLLDKLSCFAQLTLATEANNEEASALYDRVMNISVRISTAFSQCERYLSGFSDTELSQAISASETLKRVGFALRKHKEAAVHLPTAEVEKWLLKMSLTGAEAFSNLRDRLDATLTVDYRGEKLPLSSVRSLAYDPDSAVRREAYDAELYAYSKIEIPMAAAINGIKGEGLTMIDAQRYDSILQKTLDDNSMDADTLTALWTAIREALPDFRRYLRKKGELLGNPDGLPFYDLFAPVAKPGYQPHSYTADEARETLVFEMSKFSREMGSFIENAFKNSWIDLFPRTGKVGGAFCAPLLSCKQSRILTNFCGSLSDVSTLAHELGHAWHNRCMEGLPAIMRSVPMPLAETASIFNETMFAYAVRGHADEKERFTLLESELMECTQTVVDIYSRFLFESAMIEERKTHAVSVDELKTLMLDAQEKSYGDGLVKDARHPYMWACKMHYYIPGVGFYNFPYAFGLLFGKAVFAQYLKKGPDFVPTYNALLRSCGSGKIADVAASVGIDVRSVDFWRSSLKNIRDDIDEFIRLADA